MLFDHFQTARISKNYRQANRCCQNLINIKTINVVVFSQIEANTLQMHFKSMFRFLGHINFIIKIFMISISLETTVLLKEQRKM